MMADRTISNSPVKRVKWVTSTTTNISNAPIIRVVYTNSLGQPRY